VTPDSRKIRLLLDLRRKGITDTRVLAAIERVPRQIFIPEQFQDQAYMDRTLPIGHHQTISAPSIVARMSEALQVGERMKVLEIGTGSGYQAAILAELCRRLYTIERHKPLLEIAEERFHELRLTNITAIAGDGYLGWPEQAPFERVIITAAAPQVPVTLVEQLTVGGILVAPIGEDGEEQRLVRVTRHETGGEAEDLGAVRFVQMLPGIAGA